MAQMQNVLLFSGASFMVLLLILSLAGQSNQVIVPDSFSAYVLSHSWFTSHLVQLQNMQNDSVQNISTILTSYQNSSINSTGNATTVASFFGIDWSKLGAITTLLNIFAAASGFFISIFSFFASPMLLISLFRLPLIVILLFDMFNIMWWIIAIYGMFRGE